MPDDAKTDISDESWGDLIDRPDFVKEIGKEYDPIDGRWSVEKILARVFVIKGRVDEIPDEYSEYVTTPGSEIEADGNPPEPDDVTEDEAENEDDDENDDTGSVSTDVRRNASFIIDAGTMKTWFRYVDVIVDEAKIHLNEDGLSVRAVDPANVGMVDTDLYADAFESYDVPDEGVIGVNTGRIYDIVKDPNQGELVQFELDAETRTLEIEWGGHTFTLGLIDPDSIRREPDLPDLNLPVEATFEEARTLHTAIGYADDVTDHLGLSAGEGGATGRGDRWLEIVGEGDVDEYRGQFVHGEEIEFRSHEAVTSLFSLDYLKMFRKAWDKGEELSLDLGQEFPVEFHQSIPSPEENDQYVGSATYLLAPRIQSD